MKPSFTRYLERDEQPDAEFRIGSPHDFNSRMFGLFVDEAEAGTVTVALAIEIGPYRELDGWRVLDVLCVDDLGGVAEVEKHWRTSQAPQSECEEYGGCHESNLEVERYDPDYHARRRHETAQNFWRP